MIAKKKKADEPVEINIPSLRGSEIEFYILGTSPLVFNSLAEKAKHELLFPRGKLSGADKVANMKHDPISEFRNSTYRRRADEQGPTRLIFPATAFKKAIAQAALDMPGSASKAKIGRLTWVRGTYVNIFGVPQLYMAPVKTADLAKTPDIRTRAIVPEWASIVKISFTQPMLKGLTVATLLDGAGIIVGIGDGRQEKGTLSFGQFDQVPAHHPDFKRICREGGMKQQDAALNAELPVCFDQESEDLLAWYIAEKLRRGNEPDETPRRRRRAPAGGNGEEAPASP